MDFDSQHNEFNALHGARDSSSKLLRGGRCLKLERFLGCSRVWCCLFLAETVFLWKQERHLDSSICFILNEAMVFPYNLALQPLLAEFSIHSLLAASATSK